MRSTCPQVRQPQQQFVAILHSSFNIHHLISWVPQRPHLFHDTLSANIRLGKPNATHEEIVKAAKAAGLKCAALRNGHNELLIDTHCAGQCGLTPAVLGRTHISVNRTDFGAVDDKLRMPSLRG